MQNTRTIFPYFKRDSNEFLTGFTLVELMIALFVFSVGILAVFSLLNSTMRNSKEAVNNFQASQLAQEGLELVRNIRDKNWLFYQGQGWQTGLLNCALGCEIDYNDTGLSPFNNRNLKVDPNGFYNYETGSDSMFKRKIAITLFGTDLLVKSEIFWANKSFVVIDVLTDWYNQ